MTEPQTSTIGTLLGETTTIVRRYFLSLTLPLFVSLIAAELGNIALLGWLRRIVEQNLRPDEKLSIELLVDHQRIVFTALFVLLPLALVAWTLTFSIGWGATAKSLGDVMGKREPNAVDSLVASLSHFGRNTASLTLLSLPMLGAAAVFAVGVTAGTMGGVLGVAMSIAAAFAALVVGLWADGFLQLFFPLTAHSITGNTAFAEARRFAKTAKQSLIVIALTTIGVGFIGSLIASLVGLLLPSEPSPDFSELLSGNLSARDFFALAFGRESAGMVVLRSIVAVAIEAAIRAFNAVFVTLWYQSEQRLLPRERSE